MNPLCRSYVRPGGSELGIRRCGGLTFLALLLLGGQADAQPRTRNAAVERLQIGSEMRIERRLEVVEPQVVRPDGRLEFTLPEDRMRVLRPGTTGWKLSNDSVENVNGRTQVELMPEQAVFLQEQPSAVVTFSKDKQAHTFGRLLVNRRPSANAAPSLHQWDLVIAAKRLPALWESESQTYVTELLIWFQGVNTTDNIELTDPVTVEFLARDAGVKPARIQIRKTGVDGIERGVRFEASRHDRVPEVEAVTSGARSKLVIDIGADLAKISLGVQKPSIPGWGLGETTLVVTRYAQDGLPFESARSLKVTLEASEGIFPATVEIPAEESQVAVPLRSTGLGTIEVVAKAPGTIQDSARVDFLFPWGLCLVTVLFGAAGGLLRAATPRKDAPPPRWWRSALEGAFAAIVAVPLVIVGAPVINVPPEIVGTGVGALVVAAVAGYGGAAVLDYLYELFFGAKTT